MPLPDFGLPLNPAAFAAAEPAAGFITVSTGGGTQPADFAAWLRAAHAETSGSAQQAYERVALRLGITLGGPGADHG